MKRLFITSVVSLIAGLVLGFLAARNLPASREQVANYISNLSLGEAPDFFKRLHAQFGFPAFPQQVSPSSPAPEPTK
jgi:uncharacterized membrane-anchored protein YhcB (DUF1043 family)